MIANRKLTSVATMLLLLGSSVPSRGNTSQNGDASALLDCTDINATGAASSCTSFNGMIKAHDKEILDLIPDSDNARKKTFVCFVPAEDTFLIVSFDTPVGKWEWRKDPHSTDSIAHTQIKYFKYSDGVLSAFRVGFVTWSAFNDLDKAPDQLSGSAPPPAKASTYAMSADVSPSEVSVTFTYETIGGKTAHYSLQIRRATRRYAERIEVGKDLITSTGKCVEYSADTPMTGGPNN